jgi:hypothetical protein
MSSTPSHYAMELVELASQESRELEEWDYPHGGELTNLGLGDRVWMTTVEGEFPGTVIEEWSNGSKDGLLVNIDHCGPVRFHRSVFRAWTVLDHLADHR